MNDLLLYTLRTACCLAVFYLFFKLLLARETLHRLNRVVLVAATIVTFLLPLCTVTIRRALPVEAAAPGDAGSPAEAWEEPFDPTAGSAPTDEEETMPLRALTEPAEALTAAPAAAPEPFPWKRLATVLYFVGAAVVLLMILRSTLGVMRIIRRGEPSTAAGRAVIRSAEIDTPFSWGRRIVLPQERCPEEPQIVAHEAAHCRLGHSWDLLFCNLALVLQWFNPAAWLLRRELRAIHEYEADEAVIRSGADARSYQLLLVRKAVGERLFSVANNFNHSNLKNRIAMMLQAKSPRRAAAKVLLLVPLAVAALGAFAETEYIAPEPDAAAEAAVPAAIAAEAPAAERPATDYDLAMPAAEEAATAEAAGEELTDEELTDEELEESGPEILYIVDGVARTSLAEAVTPEQIESVRVITDPAEIPASHRNGAYASVIAVTTHKKTAGNGTRSSHREALRAQLKQLDRAVEQIDAGIRKVERNRDRIDRNSYRKTIKRMEEIRKKVNDQRTQVVRELGKLDRARHGSTPAEAQAYVREAEYRARVAVREAEIAARQAEIEAQQAKRQAEIQARQAKIQAQQAQRQAEIAARQAEIQAQQAQRQAEIAARQAELQAQQAARQAEQQARQAELQAQQAARQAEQQARQAEYQARQAQRQAELQIQQAQRQAEQQARQAEYQARQAQRQAELQAQQAQRQAELQAQQAQRQAELQARQAEYQARQAQRQAELQAQQAQRQAELQARQAEYQAELERKRAEYQAEQARKRAEYQAEQARKQAEYQAEQARKRAEYQAEQARRQAAHRTWEERTPEIIRLNTAQPYRVSLSIKNNATLHATGNVTFNGAERIDRRTLIYINGRQATRAQLAAITPGWIRRMTIYAGQDALEKYGKKGQYGVVVIRTR